ncbi:hypothetical protein, partial [Escherichia coli]|uniref:hypothetical protein n=1 Tax=Escherichia coli TaxID=562 RepID=UPI001960752D
VENLKYELIKILKDYNLYIPEDENLEEGELIKKIIEERKKLRENKDFKKSNEIRNKLYKLGFEIRDGRKETIIFRR